MIYDSPYMSTSYEQRFKQVLFWLIGINVGVFVLQNLLPLFGADSFLERLFSLRVDSLSRAYLWTLVSYSFLHSTGNLLHIVANMLGLFFLGRALLPAVGTTHFIRLYLFSAFVGGLFWYLTSLFVANPDASYIISHNLPDQMVPRVIGASGAVAGLLAMFAALYPNREIQVLLFFVLPIRVRPKVLAYVVVGITGFAYLFYELLDSTTTAHSAHLGGLAGGWLYFRYFWKGEPANGSGAPIAVPAWLRNKKTKPATGNYSYKVNISEPRDIKQEVDRILDKINSKGFGSLTSREKQILDEAKDLLKRR